MKMRILMTFLGALVFLGACSKGGEVNCLPPSSDELLISIEDSLGNDLILQDYPNLTLELTDNTSTHFVNSFDVSNGTTTKRAWKFNVDEMKSGYAYLLVYDSVTLDTLTVDWEMVSTVCDGTTYQTRSILSVAYNDSVFNGGGWHTVFR